MIESNRGGHSYEKGRERRDKEKGEWEERVEERKHGK